jgi:eukaryotic-like serine/threonine-protein kinase
VTPSIEPAAARRRKLADTVAAAMEAPTRDRAAIIARAADGDEAFVAEASSLVEAGVRAGGFLGGPPKANAVETARLALLNPRAALGSSIGAFRLIDVIGEGGFGVVYLAEQAAPLRRTVALKILKLGMDTREIVARFERERQALALMDHPGIAKVFGAGATDAGRPFFAMEHVPGLPITRYCDERRLNVPERLGVFGQVCAAVQHAHQKGVIHRDLKPGNILVSDQHGAPSAKVIDFGIAKAINAEDAGNTAYTERGMMLGTPAYMAPEQSGALPGGVDTRADVYALGVILYELLVGVSPFAAGGRGKPEREVPRPSTQIRRPGEDTAALASRRGSTPQQLHAALRGDLDWIVLKAIEPDRSRRYDTVKDLADDVERHLRHEPVKAAPPTTGYIVRKFVRRHRTGVIAGGLVLLALGVGAVGTTAAAIVAIRRARESDAARQLADARAVEAAAARDQAEYEQYIANLRAADYSLDQLETTRARTSLESCPERFRGWEWRWFMAKLDASLGRFEGHTHDLIAVAFSPDGRLGASASGDRTARVFEIDTGRTVAVMVGHTSNASEVAFALGGVRLVTVSDDHDGRLWDTMSGRCIAVLDGHTDRVTALAVTRDGARIATASVDRTIRLWDAETGGALCVLAGHRAEIRSLDFSFDGSLLVSGAMDGTSRVWNAITGVERVCVAHASRQQLVAQFDGPGVRFATACDDGTVSVWNAATGERLAACEGHTDATFSVRFSPDGARLLTASQDTTVRVWDARTGSAIAVMRGHRASARRAEWSSDGSRVASASFDSTLRLWQAENGRELATLRGHESFIGDLAVSPDDRLLTGGNDRTARVWSMSQTSAPIVLGPHRDIVYTAHFSDDGQTVLTGSADGSARLFSAIDGRELAAIQTPSPLRMALFVPGSPAVLAVSREGSRVEAWIPGARAPIARATGLRGRALSVSPSPNGRIIAMAGDDGNVQLFDGESMALLCQLSGHARRVTAAAFLPAGNALITAGADETVRVWDLSTGLELRTLRGPRSGFTTIAVAPGTEGVFATGDADGAARLWRLETLDRPLTLLGHEGSITGMAFSPDGRVLATVSADKTGRLWHTDSGRCFALLTGHGQGLRSVAFSPQGDRLVTSSNDTTARIWDTGTGRELAVLRGHTNFVYQVGFTRDGDRIVTASSDRTARVWNAAPRARTVDQPSSPPPWAGDPVARAGKP